MGNRKLTASDLELELPVSLREMEHSELQQKSFDDWSTGQPSQDVTNELVEETLKKTYEIIERKALEVYHSNEPWALRAWALSNILQEEIGNEVTNEISHQLISPIIEWQKEQPFDPVAYYRNILELENRSLKTIKAYGITASRFVAKVGRKRNYTDDDIIRYLTWAHKYLSTNSYFQECNRLLLFLRKLPGENPLRKLPIAIPKAPTEFRQPTFGNDEIELMAWSTVCFDTPPDVVVRLVTSMVYGARVSELLELSSKNINLDGDKSWILIPTKKGGRKKPQPIPKSLVPLYNVPLSPISEGRLNRQLRKLCRQAQITLPSRGGFHSIRRRVVTVLTEIEHSEISIHHFMRWSVPRQFAMLSRYRQTPVEESDIAILSKHPYVKLWEEVKPYILKHNNSYTGNLLSDKI